MRAMIKNYVQAERVRREENGESGFSLIELIVVVVILGILAAVAIPIFLSIQGDAEENALKSVAANAASQASAAFAQDETPTWTNFPDATITVVSGSADAVGATCIRAEQDGKFALAGPGCTGTLYGEVPTAPTTP